MTGGPNVAEDPVSGCPLLEQLEDAEQCSSMVKIEVVTRSGRSVASLDVPADVSSLARA